ncbi:Lrp/AsnC family transcriptional regulator [Nesterenkonia ebinurensis]|uniref:Lrp/AsnC family transcriptional regulator n=1 Tax=Nesterenkonia ebinurensis TaxID=2608252 RepID=UPI00123CC9F0|nr:Lrp/AsnC ligand binding domain-containing protein [Nesterenkonia ebinurensis]
MITAITMIKTDPHRIPETAQEIAAIEEVEAVYSVTGAWDLVVMVKVPDFEDLSELVPGKISKAGTIHSTETMVAFRTFSQRDLEAGFALGGD